MATDTWIGPTKGTSNFWQDPANWSKGVPVQSSDVAITAAGTYTVLITAAEHPYQIKSLTLGGTGPSARLIDSGSLSVIGAANLTHGIFDVQAGGTGSVLGNLTLSGSSQALDEGVFNIAGTLGGTAGTVMIDGGSMFAGTVAGSDRFAISLDGTLEVGGGISATTGIAFADSGADALVLDSPGTALNAAITGFGGDNSIDIGSLAFSSQYTTQYSGTTLTISNAGKAVFTITNINNPGSFALADDDSGGTVLMVCYARGTMAATPAGEVPVESLQPATAASSPMPEWTARCIRTRSAEPTSGPGRRAPACPSPPTRRPSGRSGSAWPSVPLRSGDGPGSQR